MGNVVLFDESLFLLFCLNGVGQFENGRSETVSQREWTVDEYYDWLLESVAGDRAAFYLYYY